MSMTSVSAYGNEETAAAVSVENCTVDVRIDGEKAENEIGSTDRMYESADQ